MQGTIRIPLNNTELTPMPPAREEVSLNDINNLRWLELAMPNRDCNIEIQPGDYGSFTTFDALRIQGYIESWTVEPNPDNGRPELVIRFKAGE